MMASCLLCASADLEKVQDQVLDIAGVGRCKLSFVVCRRCGLLHQNPLVAPEHLTKHYELFSNYTISDPAAARQAPPSSQTARLIALQRDAFPDARSVYEIGAAAGAALNTFKRRGFTVGGCDLSLTATAQAMEVFGITLDRADADHAARHVGDFDIVLMSHVLEHLRDPLATLKELRAHMRAGAGLILEVPCATAVDLLPPGWFAFEHISYFSPATLGAILQVAGFEPLEFRIKLDAPIAPVLAVAARAAQSRSLPSNTQADALAFAHRVAERDAMLWQETAQRLATVAGDIVIWGAGVHTAQLLSQTPLTRKARVTLIVDRDPQKWGHRLGPYLIASPAELKAGPNGPAVVVSSYAFEGQIRDALLGMGVGRNRIVTLYEDRRATREAA
jgi:SAM-dependent methyltransferase